MLKAVRACEDKEAARAKVLQIVANLHELKLPAAAVFVQTNVEETFSYFAFPSEHWRSLRTNNPLERIMREIRRRTPVVGAFPDGNSALLLVGDRLRHIAGKNWGATRYMEIGHLQVHQPVSSRPAHRIGFLKIIHGGAKNCEIYQVFEFTSFSLRMWRAWMATIFFSSLFPVRVA